MTVLSMVLAMAVFTCWCCKALLGCRKTGGEPRPRCAKLWIWFWDIEIIFIPKCLGLPDNWADIAVGEDFRSQPPVVFCSWSDIFIGGRRKHWMVGSVMIVIYIFLFDDIEIASTVSFALRRGIFHLALSWRFCVILSWRFCVICSGAKDGGGCKKLNFWFPMEKKDAPQIHI